MKLKKVYAVSLALIISLGTYVNAFAEIRVLTDFEGINSPVGLTFLEDNLFIADNKNNVLFGVYADGTGGYIGRIGQNDNYGNPVGGFANGLFANAMFNEPYAAIEYNGGLLVVDKGNNAIRYISEDKVSTFVKTGFDSPSGIALDDKGNIYVADTGNNVIKKIDANKKITVFAGSTEGYADGEALKAKFNEPVGLCFYDGGLYVTDSANQRIRLIKDGMVTTIAGSGTEVRSDSGDYEDGYEDSFYSYSSFSYPEGIAVNEQGVFIADRGNSAIRVLKDKVVSTLLNSDILSNDESIQMELIAPCGLAIKDNQLYATDSYTKKIYSIDLDQKIRNKFNFSDVLEDAWYYEAVSYCTNADLMVGTSEDTFSPNTPITRGELVTILSKIENSDLNEYTVNYFFDVDTDDELGRVVSWAYTNGIISGFDDGNFKPYETLTREQMAVIMLNYMKYLGDGPVGAWLIRLTYTDLMEISDWAGEGVTFCTMKKILSGRDDGSFDPKGTLTRAEVASIIQRFVNK